MSLVEAILLGFIQGIVEWLPISSEAVISLVMTQLLGSGVEESINSAIWLHMGTMFAALLYFREDFIELIKFSLDRIEDRKFIRDGSQIENLFIFIFLATLSTGIIGGAIYFLALEIIGSRPDLFAGITGVALLFTGFLRLYQGSEGEKTGNPDLKDSIFIGILQGLSIIPGVSRSGSTVFGLLYRNYPAKKAFQLSFLLSVPAVLIANIGLNLFSGFTVGTELLIAATVSFFIGYISIDAVLKIADRTGVAYICFLLALISFLPLFL